MTEPKILEVWNDTLSSPVSCNGPTCNDKIIWSRTVKTGARMCFTAPTVPLRVYPEEVSGREIAVMPHERNHWATCPDKQRFKK